MSTYDDLLGNQSTPILMYYIIIKNFRYEKPNLAFFKKIQKVNVWFWQLLICWYTLTNFHSYPIFSMNIIIFLDLYWWIMFPDLKKLFPISYIVLACHCCSVHTDIIAWHSLCVETIILKWSRTKLSVSDHSYMIV